MNANELIHVKPGADESNTKTALEGFLKKVFTIFINIINYSTRISQSLEQLDYTPMIEH